MAELKKAVTAVDKSTRGMTKASADLLKIVSELSNVVATSETLTQEIEFKQAELNGISETMKDSERRAKAELELKVLENAEQVLTTLMKERKLAKITEGDLAITQRNLAQAKESNSLAVSEAVEAAKVAVISEYEAKIVNIEAQHSVDTATLKADITSLNSKVNHLTDTNTRLNETIDAEREARVQMSQNTQPVFQMPKSN